MKHGIFIALLMAVSSPAWPQTQESFNSFVNGLPATTSVGPSDQFYIRQGGASKQAPLLGIPNTWSGTQSFGGGATVPTQAPGNNTSAVASTAFVAAAVRTKLVAPTNFFVNTGGNDSNTCLAPGTTNACATIQGAINKIYSIDAAGHGVGISCAASQVFTGAINLYGPILNPAFPAPITMNCNGSTVSVTGGNAIQVGQGAYLQIINTVLQTTTSGNCLEVYQNGQIFLSGGIVFNGCAGFDMEGFGQGYINAVGNYAISAGSAGHCHLTTGTVFNASNITITLSNTPAWSNWFCGLSQSSVQFFGVQFAGTGGTGQRYLVHKASSFDTGVDPSMVQPETFLPGNSVGVVDASSVYLPYKAPTTTSCGMSPSVSSAATDWSGFLTVGTGSPTGCNIVFNAAKTTAPNCLVFNDGQVPLSSFVAPPASTTGIAVTFGAASGATLHYQCVPTGL